MDRVAIAGFLRDEGNAEDRSEENAGGSSPAGSEPEAGADDDGPGRILGEAVSDGAAGINEAVSEASVAGKASWESGVGSREVEPRDLRMSGSQD